MEQIYVFESLCPITEPIPFRDVFAAAEYIYRVPNEALALQLPEKDSDAVFALSLLTNLPLEHQLRIFLLIDKMPRFRIPAQVEGCFFLPMELSDLTALLARYGTCRIDAQPSAGVLDRKCSELLLSLGISPHLQGFGMLRIGLLYLLERPQLTFLRVMDDLYPYVAEKMHTSVSIVEHSMRTAIETAWLRADLETLDAFFGYSTKAGKPTPSNSAFLYTVVDRIRHQLDHSTQAIAYYMRRYDDPGQNELRQIGL